MNLLLRPLVLWTKRIITPTVEVNVRRVSFARIVFPAIVMATIHAPAPAAAQTQAAAAVQPAARMGKEEITAFAKVEVAIGQARDSIQAQLAQSRNKTAQAQTALQDKLRAQIEEILHHNGMTEDEYKHKTYIVSTDSGTRRTFDVVVAQLTGVPTPGQVQPSGPQVKVPAGAVGTHIGHVVNGFSDTPGGQGLLPVALAEARTAAQHATLGARTPDNLAMMKTHAGHVINAIDPTIVPMGPGLGYGLKKAALGVATHIELAAKAPGASPNVVMHAMHVATAARSTALRSDSAVALAKGVQAATSAADAAALMNQLVSLTAQLTAGVDANGDGKIGWGDGEGGLQQAQEHVNLLLAGEHLPF